MMDIKKEDDLKAMASFLTNNMVHTHFRFDFRTMVTPELLKWQLDTPDYLPEWHVAVISTPLPGKPNKIMGMVTGTPRQMSIKKKVIKICSVNFLCVH